jgi:hypothetical protein
LRGVKEVKVAIQEPLELEGTWEEILTHARQLAGRRVKVIVLPEPQVTTEGYPYSTAGSLLKHMGKWAGDDLEERLREVYAARGKAQF